MNFSGGIVHRNFSGGIFNGNGIVQGGFTWDELSMEQVFWAEGGSMKEDTCFSTLLSKI